MSGGTCSHDAENGNQWMIFMAVMMACGDTMEGAPPVPKGLPWGEPCDPKKPLPTGNGTIAVDDGALISVCPDEMPEDGDCSKYVDGLKCKFFFQYMGCTWDTLSCGSLGGGECTHSSDGNRWSAWMVSNIPCSMVVDENMETAAPMPEGLPWGKSCNPNDPLPVPTDGITECPEVVPEDMDCSDYQDGLECSFASVYTGCDWESLSCTTTSGGRCTHGTKEEGGNLWGIYAGKIASCTYEGAPAVPKGLPWGEVCDPDAMLPTPPPSGKADGAEAVPVCPDVMPKGDCSDDEVGLKCSYGYMYMGCTWDALFCGSVKGATCRRDGDEGGTWMAFSKSVVPCDEGGPEGLPFGERCDPNDPIPTAP